MTNAEKERAEEWERLWGLLEAEHDIVDKLARHAGVRSLADLMRVSGWPTAWPGRLLDVPGIGAKAVVRLSRALWRLRILPSR